MPYIHEGFCKNCGKKLPEDWDNQLCQECDAAGPPPIRGLKIEDYWEDWENNRRMFADPGGRSALRAGNRTERCPTCKEPYRLTLKDVKLGYQCDQCADAAEGFGLEY